MRNFSIQKIILIGKNSQKQKQKQNKKSRPYVKYGFYYYVSRDFNSELKKQCQPSCQYMTYYWC